MRLICLTLCWFVSQPTLAQVFDSKIADYYYTHDVYIVGTTKPKLKTLRQIANFYKVPLSYLSIIDGDYIDSTYPYNDEDSIRTNQKLKKGEVVFLPPYTFTPPTRLEELKKNYEIFKPYSFKKGDTLEIVVNERLNDFPNLSEKAKQVLKHRKENYDLSVFVRENDISFQIQLPQLEKEIKAIGTFKLNDYLDAYVIYFDANPEHMPPCRTCFLYIFNQQGLMVQDPILVRLGNTGGNGKPYGLLSKLFYREQELIIYLKYYFQDYNVHLEQDCYTSKEIFIFNYPDSEIYKVEMERLGHLFSPLFTRIHLETIYKCNYEDLLKID